MISSKVLQHFFASRLRPRCAIAVIPHTFDTLILLQDFGEVLPSSFRLLVLLEGLLAKLI